jgi:hypothetical protein
MWHMVGHEHIAFVHRPHGNQRFLQHRLLHRARVFCLAYSNLASCTECYSCIERDCLDQCFQSLAPCTERDCLPELGCLMSSSVFSPAPGGVLESSVWLAQTSACIFFIGTGLVLLTFWWRQFPLHCCCGPASSSNSAPPLCERGCIAVLLDAPGCDLVSWLRPGSRSVRFSAFELKCVNLLWPVTFPG